MRWILRLVFGIVLLAVLALGAVALVPSERVAALAVGQFNSVTGRDLTIEGAVRPTIWPVLGVRTGPVTLSNADWSVEGPMLRAEGLSIQIDIASLFGGAVKITGFEVIRPQVVLERHADGRENWVFGGGNGGTASAGMAGADRPFTLDQGSIRDGTLGFIDHATGQVIRLSGIEASARLPAYDGTADITLSAVADRQAVAVSGTIDTFSTFYRGGVVPVSLQGSVGRSKIGFDGRLGVQPLMAEGQIDADLSDLAALATLAGAQPPALPAGLGKDRIAVSGALTVTAERSVHLRQGRMALDDNTLTGDADLTLSGPRPKLVAQLASDALVLTAGGGGGTDGGGSAATDGWSQAAIDLSGLAALDAEVGLAAGSIDLGTVKLGQSRAKLTIDRARAVVDLRQVAAYGGAVTGQFVMNARKGLSVGGDLNFAGIDLQPLLTDLAGYARLVGTGNLQVKFLGSGSSVAAIMRGLEGSGSLALGQGEILGLDIAGMLRTLDTSYVGTGQKTIFDSLSGTYRIDGGDLVNDDLLLTSPYLTARGAGRIGLGARDLDYRIRPTALADATGEGGLSVPLMITGPWADPRFALDLEALAQEQLADEAKALEDRARQEAAQLEADLRARAQEELGQQDGESIEDAAKRKVEDEATKLLEQLLGGN